MTKLTDLSVQELMSICPRGEWILWVYTEAGYAPEVLAPVAYRAAERALGHTTDALDRAGVPHGLHGLVITDAESARAAAGVAAGVAEWAAEVTEAAARAAWVAAWAAAQEKKLRETLQAGEWSDE